MAAPRRPTTGGGHAAPPRGPLGAGVARWSVVVVAASVGIGVLSRALGLTGGSLDRWLAMSSMATLQLALIALAIVATVGGSRAARPLSLVALVVPAVAVSLNILAAGLLPWSTGQQVVEALGWTRTGQSAALHLLLGLALFATLRGGRPLAALRVFALVIVPLASAGALWGHAFGGAGVVFVPHLVPMSAVVAVATLAAGVGVVTSAPHRWPMSTLFASDADRRLMRRLLPFVVVVPALGPAVAILAARAGAAEEVTSVIGPTITLAALIWFLGLVQRAHRRLVDEVAAHDAQLVQVLDRLPVAVMLRAHDGTLLHCNPGTERFLRRLGIDVDAVEGGPSQLVDHVEVVDEDGRVPDPDTLPVVTALRDGREHSATLGYATSGGERAWYSVRAAPVELPDGTTGVVVSLDDVTERHEARRRADLAERSLRRTFEQAPIGIAVHAVDGSLLQVNAALCDLLGTEEQTLLAHGLPWVEERSAPDGRDPAGPLARWTSATSDRVVEERWLRHAEGRVLVVEVALAIVRDDDLRPVRLVVQVVDVTAKRALEDELRLAAVQDPLTGLSNRRALADRLDVARQRRDRGGGDVGLLFLDLDAFKTINDDFGHDTGDRVLCDTARRLVDATRETDTVCRLGGDEFVVLCTPIDGQRGLDELVARVAAAPPVTCELEGRVARVTWSVGAVLLGAEEGLDAVLRRADAAMYGSKRSTRSDRGHLPRPTPAGT